MPLLATPPTVTTTFPVVAPAGTGHDDGSSRTSSSVRRMVPLKETVLVPLGRAEIGAGDRHRRADRPARRQTGS